jgi:hypothetical protein
VHWHYDRMRYLWREYVADVLRSSLWEKKKHRFSKSRQLSLPHGRFPGVWSAFISSVKVFVSWSHCFSRQQGFYSLAAPRTFKVRKNLAGSTCKISPSSPVRCGQALWVGIHHPGPCLEAEPPTTQTHHRPQTVLLHRKGPGELSTDPISTWAISLHPFKPPTCIIKSPSVPH